MCSVILSLVMAVILLGGVKRYFRTDCGVKVIGLTNRAFVIDKLRNRIYLGWQFGERTVRTMP
jgi:hypothetical protein